MNIFAQPYLRFASHGLAMSSLQLTAMRVASVVLQSSYIFFLAHQIPVRDMGIFVTFYAILGVARALCPLGSDQFILRQLSGSGTATPSIEMREIAAGSMAMTLGISAIAALLIVILLPLMAGTDGILISEAAILCLAIPSFGLTGSLVAQIRALGKNVTAQAPEALGLHVIFALFLAALYLSGSLTRFTAITALGVTSWLVVGMYWWIRHRSGLQGFSVPRFARIKFIVANSWSVFQALLVTSLSMRAPVFLAGLWISPAAAAIIDIAIRFGSVPTVAQER